MKSHGMWWLTQFRRWGMVKEAPDYKGLVDRVHRPDIFREVAKEMGVETPREDVKKETFFDGVVFDPPPIPRSTQRASPCTRWRRAEASMTRATDQAPACCPCLGSARRARAVDRHQPDRRARSAVAGTDLGGVAPLRPRAVLQGRRDEPGHRPAGVLLARAGGQGVSALALAIGTPIGFLLGLSPIVPPPRSIRSCSSCGRSRRWPGCRSAS